MNSQVNTQRNYLGPFLTMVFLFLVVGFLTTANGQFQGPLKAAFLADAGQWKNTLATLITFSWFLAYPLCGNIGAQWIGKYGYKGTLIRGLIVMIIGLALFLMSSGYTVVFPESSLDFPGFRVPAGFLIFLSGSFVAGASATPSADLVKKYQGKRVRIFLETGTIVSGDVQFDGHWADVNNQQARKSALCNMSHVVSITKDEG